jgi:hypothetical protein
MRIKRIGAFHVVDVAGASNDGTLLWRHPGVAPALSESLAAESFGQRPRPTGIGVSDDEPGQSAAGLKASGDLPGSLTLRFALMTSPREAPTSLACAT